MIKDKTGIKGSVRIRVWDKFGNKKYPDELVPNQVQNAGMALCADRILKDAPGSEDGVDYIAVGTGSGQNAAATTLATEVAASGLSRAAGTGTRTTTTVANDTAQLVVTFTVSGTVAVTEAGIFNASSAGDMLCYDSSFSTKNVESGDTLEITWTVVFAAA